MKNKLFGWLDQLVVVKAGLFKTGLKKEIIIHVTFGIRVMNSNGLMVIQTRKLLYLMTIVKIAVHSHFF